MVYMPTSNHNLKSRNTPSIERAKPKVILLGVIGIQQLPYSALKLHKRCDANDVTVFSLIIAHVRLLFKNLRFQVSLIIAHVRLLERNENIDMHDLEY